MRERDLELAVGDTLRVGDYLLTLLDVEGDEVTLRIDELPADRPITLTAPDLSETGPTRCLPR